MYGKIQKSMGWSLTFAILVGGALAADKEADKENGAEEAKHPFSVKFVDENGKPVEGAKAGVIAYFPGYQHLTTIDETGWHYDLGGTSRKPVLLVESPDLQSDICILDGEVQHMHDASGDGCFFFLRGRDGFRRLLV